MGELLMQMNRIAEAKPHLDSARVLAGEMGVMDLSVKHSSSSRTIMSETQLRIGYNGLLTRSKLNDSILNAETLKRFPSPISV
jgi:hypothetical protein